jgi:bacterioferritin-associated ferredoxin
MIICICNTVSDRHIRTAVRAGACSLRDLTRELRVGTCCGKCVPEARAALASCLAREASTHESVYFSAQTPEFAA